LVFCGALWCDRLACWPIVAPPTKQRTAALRARFDRIFGRKTGFVTLDRLLARLSARRFKPKTRAYAILRQ
jgi:hypothetical protein